MSGGRCGESHQDSSIVIVGEQAASAESVCQDLLDLVLSRSRARCRQGPSGRSGGGLGGFVAVAVARRWQLRAWVVLVVKRSAYRRPTYRLGARSKLVVEALIFGMARFTAHRTGWSRVLGRVLVDLGIVCVSREKSCGGRSASTVTLVNVRPVLLFHKKLKGE